MASSKGYYKPVLVPEHHQARIEKYVAELEALDAVRAGRDERNGHRGQ